MAGVSIGEVSAMINAAIIILQVTFPLAVVLVIVGILKDRESAATWTLAARSIQNSFWPTILRSDQSVVQNVRIRVVLMSWLTTLGTILMIIVGISTPLGLSDKLQVGDTQDVTWEYVHDTGPMGRGTPDRAGYNYSRVCDPFNCPGVNGGYETWLDDEGGFMIQFDDDTDIADLRIPSNVSEVFTSGTANTTVSSIFDIQYRSYQHKSTAFGGNVTNFPYQNNSLYTSGKISTLQSVILDGKIELVEGLIVDTIYGGIGFRNHTIPVDVGLGQEWQEEILWIEPVTECVSLNLTVEFNQVMNSQPWQDQSILVDHGGMVNLAEAFPFIDQNDTQGDPELYATAYRAAAFTNLLTADLFNLTLGKSPGKATLGAKYNLTGNMPPYPAYIPKLNEINIGPVNGNFLPLPNFMYNMTGDVTSENFTMVDLGTRRFGGLDVVNMSTVGIINGMIMGAPHLADGSDTLILEPETNWVQNIMTCSSATRASIKIVKFLANGTALDAVQVLSVADKTYSSEADMPLWAIEKSNISIKYYSPLWGIVDDRYEDSDALWVRRKEKLWLPAGTDYNSGATTSVVDSTPAGAHIKALSAAYDVGNSLATSLGIRDYSAENDFGLYLLWRDMSRDSKEAGKIINLIWTDIMANIVVGTKPGQFSSDASLGEGASYNRVVRSLERKVTYDVRYAIPAFLMLVLWLSILATALTLFLLSRISLSALTQLANQLASGRMASNFYSAEKCRADAPSSEWVTKAGGLVFIFQRIRSGISRSDNIEALTELQRSNDDDEGGNSREDLHFVPLDEESSHGPPVPVGSIMRRRGRGRALRDGFISRPKDKLHAESSSFMQTDQFSAPRTEESRPFQEVSHSATPRTSS